jgi:hypothetical protein
MPGQPGLSLLIAGMMEKGPAAFPVTFGCLGPSESSDHGRSPPVVVSSDEGDGPRGEGLPKGLLQPWFEARGGVPHVSKEHES